MMRQGKKVVGKMKAPEPCTHSEQKDRGNENPVHTEGNPKETTQEELQDEKSGQTERTRSHKENRQSPKRDEKA